MLGEDAHAVENGTLDALDSVHAAVSGEVAGRTEALTARRDGAYVRFLSSVRLDVLFEREFAAKGAAAAWKRARKYLLLAALPSTKRFALGSAGPGTCLLMRNHAARVSRGVGNGEYVW